MFRVKSVGNGDWRVLDEYGNNAAGEDFNRVVRAKNYADARNNGLDHDQAWAEAMSPWPKKEEKGEGDGWSSESPTEPGWYWFYGAASSCLADNIPPKLLMVELKLSGFRRTFTCGIEVMYPWNMKGKWKRAEQPKLPID